MELIVLLRRLWRRRLLAAAGLLIAIASTFLLAGGSTLVFGVASARLVVSTLQARQSASNSSSSPAPLPDHAQWVADLLATDTARGQIAGAAGIPANQLAVVDGNVNRLVVATALPTAVSQASA